MRHVDCLRLLILVLLLLVAPACRTAPLDDASPGARPPAPSAPTAPRPPTTSFPSPVRYSPTRTAAPQGVPWSVEIDERVSPTIDCNPVRTQHTLVVTVRDQCGNPLPGQRVEWSLSRYPQAVGDIVAVDDQYGSGRIAPMTSASPGNNGNKIDNQYAVSVTNYGAELIDAGNNHPYVGREGVRLPDITVSRGQSWLTITSSREGVTDLMVYVPALRDGTKHKIWAKKIWADFDVEFPENAVNTLPDVDHSFLVRIFRSDGSAIPGQTVDAEILDGPSAVFESSSRPTASFMTDANGVAEFLVHNTVGETGVNRIRFTANGHFYGEICPRSAIVTKQWRQAALEVSCAYLGCAEAIVNRPFEKLITVTNTGDAPAEAVVLEDQPDAGLAFAGGSAFPMDLGTIAPGQTVTRSVQMIAETAGAYTNRVIVSSRTSGAQAENVCPIEVVAGVLEIMKVCEPQVANVGSEVTFVVTVTNSGRGPLENVMVVDDYPAGIEPTSQNAATLGTLAPGESKQVIFTGIAEQPGRYTNTARARADGFPEQTSSCDLQVVNCRLEMDLVGPETIYYGEQANFTVRVTNVGDGPAEGCMVRVTTGNCLGNVVRDFNIGPLGPGEVWTQDFAGRGSGIGQCTVTADSNCGARCQDRVDVQLDVTGLPALQVEMTDKGLDGSEEGIFRVGETFIYRMLVENDVGTEATPNMHVEWRLPPELEFVSGRSNREATVTGTDQLARSEPFGLKVNQVITFELQVRVLSAPNNGLVKTAAAVYRSSDNAELASESESSTLKN